MTFPYHLISQKAHIHNRASSLSHHPHKDWETQSSLLTATDHPIDKTLPTFTSETKVKYAKFLIHKSTTSPKILSPNSTFFTKNLPPNPSSTSKSLVNLIQKTFSKAASPRHELTASDQTLKLPESTLETIKVPASRHQNLDASKTSSSFFGLKSDLNTTKDRDTAELPRPGSQMIKVFDSEYENKKIVKSPKKNRRHMTKSLYASTVNSPTVNKPQTLYMDIRDKELSIELPFRYKSQEKIDPKNLCFALKKASYKKNSHIHQYLLKPQSPSVVSTTHENSLVTPTEPPQTLQNNPSQVRIYSQNLDSSAHLAKALASSSPFKYKKPVTKHRPMTTGYDFGPKRIRSSGASPKSSTIKSSFVKTEDFQSRVLLQDAFETPEHSFSKVLVFPGGDQTMTIHPLSQHKIKQKSKLMSRLEASTVENSERAKNLSHRSGKIIGDLKVETVENSMEISQVPERPVEEHTSAKFRKTGLDELLQKLAANLPKRRRQQDEEYELASQNAMKGEHVKLSLQSSAMGHEYTFTKDAINKLADQVGDIEEEKEKLQHIPPKTLDLASPGTKTLNELEFSTIREEYLKKRVDPESVNYENVDKLIARLKFFAGLSKNVRINLLKVASYKFFPSGATIYKEGDLCDQMYIIVRGSVNQRQKTKTSYGTTENLIVATLYDGRQFGEDNTYATSVRKTQILPTKNETVILNPKNHRKSTLAETTSSIVDGIGLRNNRKNSSQEPTPEVKKKSIVDKIETFTAYNQSPRYPFSSDKSRRECTMEAAEPCDMLCISIDKFKDIFVTLVQKEIEDRLNVLSGLPFLDKFDQFGLIPIANNLVTKTYRMGEVILAAGDPVEKFQIVSKGKCKLILGAMKKSNLEPPETLHGRLSTTINFNTGTPDYSCKLTAVRTGVGETLKKAAKEKGLDKKINYQNRTFAFDKMGIDDNHLSYMHHIQLDRLFQGDFFGGRALLTEIDMFEQPELNQMRHMLGKNSQLSVVADTASVEIFEIDKAGLDYLPDHLVKMLKKGLRIQTEFDDYDIKKIVKENKKMMEFQDKTTDDVFRYRKIVNGTTYKKF